MNNIFFLTISFIFFTVLPIMSQDDQTIFERDLKKSRETPRIDIKYEIVLSPSMKNVLKQKLPDFKVIPSESLYPGTLTNYEFTNNRAKENLRINQCPSAVIGDFNGDGKTRYCNKEI